MERIPERQSSPIWYRVVCLLYELVLSHEYRDALENQRFRINFVVFEINEEEENCWQAVVEFAWPLLCAVRNASEAKREAKQELDYVKQELVQVQEQLQQ